MYLKKYGGAYKDLKQREQSPGKKSNSV